MPQSLSQIYLHIVFSTKHRYPFLDGSVDDELYAYIGASINRLGGIPIAINGVCDHIHILTAFPRTITVADFVKDIKANSSRWLKTKGEQYQNFGWQDGYGVFSVSSSKKQVVANYIARQKEHHRKTEYKNEFLQFLHEYSVKYDERYVWD
jgi:REP element-mobilizing transposase RayT